MREGTGTLGAQRPAADAPDHVGAPDHADSQALIEEARRRHRRRRRLVVGGLALAVAGVVVAGLVAGGPGGPSSGRRGRPAGSRDGARPTGPPPGRTVPLEQAGPLAIGPDGRLYVADEARNEILVRQPGGTFRVVAGGGRTPTGSGGAATAVALSDIADLAFDARGDLYIADGDLVQEVSPAGTIRTVAGRGGSPRRVAGGTPALAARLGPVASIAFSPKGVLYLATASQILRLGTGGRLRTVRAVVSSGPGPHGVLSGFGQMAVDDRGDVYVSSGSAGWSFYRVAPDGSATSLGYARRDGGSDASVTRGPHDAVYVESGSNVEEVEGGELTTVDTLDGVPGTAWFTLDYFAVAPGGTLYADDLGQPAEQPLQKLVADHGGHFQVLWDHANQPS